MSTMIWKHVILIGKQIKNNISISGIHKRDGWLFCIEVQYNSYWYGFSMKYKHIPPQGYTETWYDGDHHSFVIGPFVFTKY